MPTLNQIIQALHDYTVPDLGIKFVNREQETEKILSNIIKLNQPTHPTNSLIHVITGPWGCGKTELFKALTQATNKIRELKERTLTLYINLSEEEIDKACTPTPNPISQTIKETTRTILKDHLKTLLHLYTPIRALHDRLHIKEKKIIITFDEATRSLEKYKIPIRDLIAGLSKKIYDIAWEYNAEIHTILLTSEQTAIEHFSKQLGKNMTIHLLWNLQKTHIPPILKALKSPIDTQTAWKITGGNPREIYKIHLHQWNLKPYIEEQIATHKQLLRKYTREKRENPTQTLTELAPLLDNIDDLDTHPIWDTLIQNNITIYIDARYRKISQPPTNTEWIGKRIAFQTPIHYHILKTMTTRKTTDITPQQILPQLTSQQPPT